VYLVQPGPVPLYASETEVFKPSETKRSTLKDFLGTRRYLVTYAAMVASERPVVRPVAVDHVGA
jgi:hypothetical protein